MLFFNNSENVLRSFREFNNKITQEVTEFLSDIIKEEPDEVNQNIFILINDYAYSSDTTFKIKYRPII